MNCPICNVGLKIAGHRGVSVNYCPLCGGTWLDKGGFDRLPSVARVLPQGLRVPRRLLRIVILTALILFGCLIATISVGAIKLWPTVRGWAEAVLTGKEISLTHQVRQLASCLDDPGRSRLGLSTWNAEPTTTSARREIGSPDRRLSLIGIYAAAAQVYR